MVVRPNPVFFKLPQADSVAPSSADTDTFSDNCKENQSPASKARGLHYRSVFAVLTMDSILVYDTHHTRPLSVIRGLHYAGLSDCQWSADGMKLIVSSIDGYISIVSFENGELGEVYKRPQRVPPVSNTTGAPPHTSLNDNTTNNNAEQSPVQPSFSSSKVNLQRPQPKEVFKIPPCEPGQSATIEAPPSKRPKKTRIAPTLISAPNDSVAPAPTDPLANESNNKNSSVVPSKRPAADLLLENETHNVGEAVTKLTIANNSSSTEEKGQPKKKKRIQPMLVSN